MGKHIAPITSPATLHITRVTLRPQQVLHRVHLQTYHAAQFNPGQTGDARFSPIQNRQGQPIPTLYAADTFQAALMESVFHDVPHDAGFKLFDRRKLHRQVHSQLEIRTEFVLADLISKPLEAISKSFQQQKSRRKLYKSEEIIWIKFPSAQ